MKETQKTSKRDERHGRVGTPTNQSYQSFGVCKVNPATLKVSTKTIINRSLFGMQSVIGHAFTPQCGFDLISTIAIKKLVVRIGPVLDPKTTNVAGSNIVLGYSPVEVLINSPLRCSIWSNSVLKKQTAFPTVKRIVAARRNPARIQTRHNHEQRKTAIFFDKANNPSVDRKTVATYSDFTEIQPQSEADSEERTHYSSRRAFQ